MPDGSLPDRVESTVYAWAGIEKPIPTTTALKVIWSAAGKSATTPFPDPATMDLIIRLTAEFKSGNDARVLTGMTPELFADGGKIGCIDNLVDWVRESPAPKTNPV
jgi:hypothetical protein